MSSAAKRRLGEAWTVATSAPTAPPRSTLLRDRKEAAVVQGPRESCVIALRTVI